MPEQSKPFAPIDPGRVNTMDAVEVGYWAERLGCTPEALLAAAAAVGEHVTEMRDELRRRGLHPR